MRPRGTDPSHLFLQPMSRRHARRGASPLARKPPGNALILQPDSGTPRIQRAPHKPTGFEGGAQAGVQYGP
ncbi:hypothetical protein NDU88_001804 [Pleurodeles waltl]|uniref:Uncharacterized protein n=1 Tax=Pleurodeles waltl TaxID=8319 RepID=A0AAV7V8T9_PLEWA|nr:hypothetical protein NDU88_001804 [Pleurodeles waltl]